MQCPKALIRLGGVPLLTRWVELLAPLAESVETMVVVTNERSQSITLTV